MELTTQDFVNSTTQDFVNSEILQSIHSDDHDQRILDTVGLSNVATSNNQ